MIAHVPAASHTQLRPYVPGQTFLRIDHVAKSFARGATSSEVLADIDLSIDRGEYVAMIGHSGCGKSTLLNIVAGLLSVSSGAVLLRTRRSTSRGLTAPWCSRIFAAAGSPSTTTCAWRWTGVLAPQAAQGAARLDHAQPRAGADGARQGQAADGDLGRHEAARRYRPRAWSRRCCSSTSRSARRTR
jgi:ABC-type cobalamin/Fe3+-siderophores transport system ATPase subunit